MAQALPADPAPGLAELAAVRAHSARAVAAAFVFSAVVNLLMLTAPLYMLQVYDRVIASASRCATETGWGAPQRYGSNPIGLCCRCLRSSRGRQDSQLIMNSDVIGPHRAPE